MLDVAAEHCLESIVSKRLDSVWRPGQRPRSWIKTALRRSAGVVVAGRIFREELHLMHDSRVD
ncbi:hypothetical protein A5780_06515 [Nocardia sp. 852002-20019_SCH5090214]|uniref:ATP-dependent DNA ligase family profile domain-containing protein n=1 Tax=Nocardia nova TaxID=37330 RepID=A0A2S6A048_9NOCA|nr:hypothetical protein A5780_06515 [Nocardia sp. 852002-20019_SCH5090214]PPI91608.1 hypothetical protein C5E46_30165 [Nocardia nova]PPJ24328.1 hypothetical protein C5F51_26490 [Nocardia nova]